MEPRNNEITLDDAATSATPSNETEEKKSRKKRWIILLLLLLLLLGAGAFIGFKLIQPSVEVDTPSVAVMPDMDANAKDLGTREELEEAMQQEADSAYFTLQVNPEATFSSKTGEGTFELINPTTNTYPISFTITLDESGEELYRSGSVMPGQQITGITLDTKLAPGTYDATVSVSIYNDSTHEQEGETQAKIDLIIT